MATGFEDVDTESEVAKFWAYRHVNGGIQVKRYTSEDAIDDAYDSPFVDEVLEPYTAKDKAEADRIAKERLTVKP